MSRRRLAERRGGEHESRQHERSLRRVTTSRISRRSTTSARSASPAWSRRATASQGTPSRRLAASRLPSASGHDKANEVSFFSNVAPFLSLFAPGEAIRSSVPGAASAISAVPRWRRRTCRARGRSSARRLPNGQRKSRAVGAAHDRPADHRHAVVGRRHDRTPHQRAPGARRRWCRSPTPYPSLTSFAPARLRAGTAAATITLNGSNFNAFSIALWNGVPRPTTVVSTSQLTAVISAADLNAAGPSAQVAVLAPAPGGGTSAALTVPIDPPPSLVPSRSPQRPGRA